MAENRVTFIKSKMNKDLDDRIVPPGEYRDAQNVSVSRSEDADVGALENVLGNVSISDFGLSDTCGVEVIGYVMDEENNRIFVLMTNFTDNSPDRLSNKAYISTTSSLYVTGPVECYIGVKTIGGAGSLIVSGAFLNFSKTHSVTGINLLEDLLFWTDNRNQPRKINVTRAINDPNYYSTEDHISVAKLYPWEPIDLIDKSVNQVANDPFASTMKDVTSPYLPDGTTVNPDYDLAWKGDAEYLKDKFVRFSYRFKFDDGEYSLIAPFTQIAFIPQQDGYFIDEDIDDAYKSTELAFFRNKVNQIELRIQSPLPIFGNQSANGSVQQGASWEDVFNLFKITDIDILYKESDGLSIKTLDTINKDTFGVESGTTYRYSYNSRKPYKTLPNKEIVRVYDQVPLRALSQEIVGNRVVYGNYIDKGTAPANLAYVAQLSNKDYYGGEVNPTFQNRTYSRWNNIKEYPNHTLKQNRTYQVGIVLCDRYGRQSNVILSTYDEDSNNSLGSTIYNPYKDNDWIANGNLATNTTTWPGDELNALFYNTIPVSIQDAGYPSLFWTDLSFGLPTQGEYNEATGWCTMKLVVKQTQQEYYNIYFPGVLSGNFHEIGSASNPEIHIILQSDNINKVPRSLQDVGPEQQIFRTSKPSGEDIDRAYVKQWLINAGYPAFDYDLIGQGAEVDIDFDLDQPKIKELLAERDRLAVLADLKNKDNSSMEMWLRVRNKYTTLYAPTTQTVQYFPQPSKGPLQGADTVTLVGKASDLGLYTLDTTAAPITTLPAWAAGSTYDYYSNPLVAKIKPNGPLQWGVSSASGPNNWMIPELAIYETAPIESNLDIYWETASAFPINWVNNEILLNDYISPFYIRDYASTGSGVFADWLPPITVFSEDDPVTSNVVQEICMVNPIGGPGAVLSGSMQLLTAYVGSPAPGGAGDGPLISPTDVTSSFNLVNNIPNQTWYLKMSETLYCAPSIPTYDFTIRCTTAGAVGEPDNIVDTTFRCPLNNIKADVKIPIGTPTISGCAEGGYLYTLQAENGTAKTSEVYKDLHWHISLQKVHATSVLIDYFYLVPDPVDGQIQLWSRPITATEAAVGTFNVQIKVKDRPWNNYFVTDLAQFLVDLAPCP